MQPTILKNQTSKTDLLWAKWGVHGEQRYSLIAHLIDTSAAADALIADWLPTRVVNRLSQMLCTDAPGFRKIVVSAAGLHDLGKASPLFQGQLRTPREAEFAQHMADLSNVGLTCPPDLPKHYGDLEGPMLRRHEIASAVLLNGIYDLAGTSGLAAIVSGHHGRWRIPDEYDTPYACTYYEKYLSNHVEWAEVHEDIIKILSDVAGIEPQLEVPDMAATPILTGLVCLADWLASDTADQHQYEARLLDESWESFYKRRRAYFPEVIGKLLGRANRPQQSFKELFGFEADRPVQQHLLQTNQGPGLTVVMVPTGDGKTEGALGHWITNATDGDGLYFALPTMGTADAMFDRVQNMFTAAHSPTLGSLLHGRAILNDFYQPTSRDLVGEIDAGNIHHSPKGLTPGAWFQGRHRALFAPVAVGTIDQLLSSMLRHPFNFMRLLGAATKTLVLDEVHSYDPYMSVLLERLLVWAGELHIDVVLLSATLPTTRLRAYIAAYSGTAPDPDLYPPYPGVVRAAPIGQREAPVVTALESSGRDRVISLDIRVGANVELMLAETIRQLAADHPIAKIGVIVNTVGRCQRLAEQLNDLHPDVLHSRFPAAMRAKRTNDIINRYGKRSEIGPALLVATQIVEQSLDLDFDILVSDLAPAAALLQRIGRLWRHDRGPDKPRPDTMKHPSCVIVAPNPLPIDPYGFLPYSAAEIHATWNALDQGNQTNIVIPQDVQALIDATNVTVEDAMATGGLPADQIRQKLAEHHLMAGADQTLTAARRTIPQPKQLREDPAYHLPNLTAGELDEHHHQTRWIQQRTATLLLCGTAPNCYPHAIPSRPSTAELRELLNHTVSVSGHLVHLTEVIVASGRGASLQHFHALLEGVYILDLDITPELELNPQLGLRATGAIHA